MRMECKDCVFHKKPMTGAFVGQCRITDTATRPDDECLHSEAGCSFSSLISAAQSAALTEATREKLLEAARILAGTRQKKPHGPFTLDKIPMEEPATPSRPVSKVATEKTSAVFHKTVTGCYAPPSANDDSAILYAASVRFDPYGNAIYGTGLWLEIPKGWIAMVIPLGDVSLHDLVMSPSPIVITHGMRQEITVSFKPAAAFCECLRRKAESESGYDFVTIPARQDFSPEQRRYPVPDECAFNARIYKIGEPVCQVRFLPVQTLDISLNQL